MVAPLSVHTRTHLQTVANRRVWGGVLICYLGAYLFLIVLAGTRLRRVPYNRFRTGNLLFKWQVGSLRHCLCLVPAQICLTVRTWNDMHHALLRCMQKRQGTWLMMTVVVSLVLGWLIQHNSCSGYFTSNVGDFPTEMAATAAVVRHAPCSRHHGLHAVWSHAVAAPADLEAGSALPGEHRNCDVPGEQQEGRGHAACPGVAAGPGLVGGRAGGRSGGP